MGDKIRNKREMVFHDMNQSKIQPKRAQENNVFGVRFVLKPGSRDWRLETRD
jgi:hypothetical protein